MCWGIGVADKGGEEERCKETVGKTVWLSWYWSWYSVWRAALSRKTRCSSVGLGSLLYQAPLISSTREIRRLILTSAMVTFFRTASRWGDLPKLLAISIMSFATALGALGSTISPRSWPAQSRMLVLTSRLHLSTRILEKIIDRKSVV